MTPDRATDIAAQALLWMTQFEDALTGFLGASGADANGLRAQAHEPEFLGFVLDYIMSIDDLARQFCQEHGFRGEDLFAARQALPGGEAPHWT